MALFLNECKAVQLPPGLTRNIMHIVLIVLKFARLTSSYAIVLAIICVLTESNTLRGSFLFWGLLSVKSKPIVMT